MLKQLKQIKNKKDRKGNKKNKIQYILGSNYCFCCLLSSFILTDMVLWEFMECFYKIKVSVYLLLSCH